jgi:hypothetical protein
MRLWEGILSKESKASSVMDVVGILLESSSPKLSSEIDLSPAFRP